MKKINLKGVFESIVKGDSRAAKKHFHNFTINEGRKIVRKLKESEDFDDALEGKEECSITICLNDSVASTDDVYEVVNDVFEENEIEGDVTFDEEDNKFTLTFDCEDEADNFISIFTDRVNSLEIDEIEFDDGCDDEEELTVEEGFDPDRDFYSSEEEKAIEKSVDDFDFEDFIKEYGSDFAWDDRKELGKEDKVISKEEVVGAISHYLCNYSSRFFDYEEDNNLRVEDFDDVAEELYDDSVRRKFERAGYEFPKPLKESGGFDKIADEAAKEYGSKEAGDRVAGAVLSKLRKEHPRKYSAKNLREDEMGDNQSPIDIARRMGYHDAKDGSKDRYNGSLRSLMNNVLGDRQRRDIHNAYIAGMDDFKEGKKLRESAEDKSLILDKVYTLGQECGRTCHDSGDKNGIVKRNALKTVISNHRKEIENREVTKDALIKEFNRGFDNFKGLKEAKGASRDSYVLKLTFPSDGDSFIVDKIEDKLEKRDFDFKVTYNDIDDNGIRIFRVEFKSSKEVNEAKKLISNFMDAMDVDDFNLSDKEEREELKEDEMGDNQSPIDIARRMGYEDEKNGCADIYNKSLRALMNNKPGQEQRRHVYDAYRAGIDDFKEGRDIHESVDLIEDDCDEDKLDLILAKISSMESQIDELVDGDDDFEGFEFEEEEELPELTESYFQKEEDELMDYLERTSDDEITESFKLEKVDTKKYINKDLKNDDSPFTDVDFLRMDLRKAGIADPSVDNAKGYTWKKIPYKGVDSMVKGEVRNKERKLERVNPYDKDAIINKVIGKENTKSPLGSTKVTESKKRGKVLRKRK